MSTVKKISAFFMSLLAAFVLTGPATFSPLDADNLKLNFSVISDTHIGPFVDGARSITLAKGLKDMAKARAKSDALIIAGDMTENGMANEYYKLGVLLKSVCKADQLLLEMGNHDVRGIAVNGTAFTTYQYNAGKYYEFLNKVTGYSGNTVYFYKIVKGCYFIVLNSESLETHETVLSDTQIQWADSLLAEAAAGGNPVFIINHQPLANIGDESEALAGVMRKYSGILDIFFITGHCHDGFSANTITNEGTVYFVDMPSYGKAPDGDYGKTGTGFQVELYKDEIAFRARDFSRGKWLEKYDRTIDLIGE